MKKKYLGVKKTKYSTLFSSNLLILFFSDQDIDKNDILLLKFLKNDRTFYVLTKDITTKNLLNNNQIKFINISNEPKKISSFVNNKELHVLFNDKYKKSIPEIFRHKSLRVISYTKLKANLFAKKNPNNNFDLLNIKTSSLEKAYAKSEINAHSNKKKSIVNETIDEDNDESLDSDDHSIKNINTIDPFNIKMMALLNWIVERGSAAYRFKISFYFRFFGIPIIVIYFAVSTLNVNFYYFWAIMSYICFTVNFYYVLHQRLLKVCYPQTNYANKFLSRFTFTYLILTMSPTFLIMNNVYLNFIIIFFSLILTIIVNKLCLLMSYRYRYREVRFINYLPFGILFILAMFTK